VEVELVLLGSPPFSLAEQQRQSFVSARHHRQSMLITMQENRSWLGSHIDEETHDPHQTSKQARGNATLPIFCLEARLSCLREYLRLQRRVQSFSNPVFCNFPRSTTWLWSFIANPGTGRHAPCGFSKARVEALDRPSQFPFQASRLCRTATKKPQPYYTDLESRLHYRSCYPREKCAFTLQWDFWRL
jgi:hypothetical protein